MKRFLFTGKKLLSGALVASLLFVGAAPVSAQSPVLLSEDSTATISGSPDPSLPSPTPENSQLVLLRERYRTELSIYRTDEREYTIAKEQYNQIKTLAALEASVQATRKVMLSRIQVLQTYLQILDLMVEETSGIDVTEKQNLLNQLDTALARSQTHEQLTEKAIDRQLVAGAVADFQSFSGQITDVSYKALSYIAYGRLQTVYDKMVSVKEEVNSDLEAREQNGLRLGEKRRAMDEINRNLASTKSRLDEVRQTFVPQRSVTNRQFNSGTYSETINSLTQVYADLFRNLNFLREVSKR